ncbi:hypothetical protein PEDI_35870 [Persicobacter diffluens]|uniref:Uncharacterized protein n=1 Tax=Persicobacter diffluens TaxID=981 RepID=A0AAN4W2Z6_9BACT|nr:hypothetical protein PEDI_35870 [Persicobacter diffluens]
MGGENKVQWIYERTLMRYCVLARTLRPVEHFFGVFRVFLTTNCTNFLE